MSNILITGGGGFIGFEAACKLKELGHNVAILDKNPNEFRWAAAKKNKIIRIYADVLDVNMLNFDKFKIEAIIHCAAQTAVTKSLEDPLEDFITNARGTFEVCEFARKNDAEIIFTSTNKVYGENVNKYAVKLLNNKWTLLNNYIKPFEIDETFPVDVSGHTPYGCSKLAADLYVQDYHHTYGLKTNIYRMSCIYGESQTGTEDQGWVYHIINQIVNNNEVKIFGDGCQVRDILHVDDLVELMKLTFKKNMSDVFNIGGGKERTISVLELIDFVSPKYENISFHPWRPADQMVYVSDITKAKRELGWEPQISKEHGLVRIINKLKMVKK